MKVILAAQNENPPEIINKEFTNIKFIIVGSVYSNIYTNGVQMFMDGGHDVQLIKTDELGNNLGCLIVNAILCSSMNDNISANSSPPTLSGSGDMSDVLDLINL